MNTTHAFAIRAARDAGRQLAQFQAFIDTLDAAIAQQRSVLAAAEVRIDEARPNWQNKKRTVGSFEILQARGVALEAKRDARREQRDADEHAAKILRADAAVRRNRPPHSNERTDMPPLPLLGALLDTAGTALAARGAGSSSAAGTDAATATTAVPFAQTLKQSVATRRDASNAGVPDASTQQASSKPAAGTKPSATEDDDTTDDTTTNAATDAAALAAAAAVQAQLQARTDNALPADGLPPRRCAKTAVSGQPDATATLADHAAKDVTAATQAAPATSRDVLQDALAKLTGGAGAIAMPAAGTTASAPAATAATASTGTAAPLTPKVPTFDRTLADAKGALATQQAPVQATAQALQANANAQSGEQHALAAASDAADPAASATLAAGATAAAAAQTNLQLSPAAGRSPPRTRTCSRRTSARRTGRTH